MPKEKKIDEIRRICDEKGLNIYEVFRRAGIPTTTIGNWKKRNPGAFDTYDTVMETIETMAVEPV